jgi:hypothetical protein
MKTFESVDFVSVGLMSEIQLRQKALIDSIWRPDHEGDSMIFDLWHTINGELFSDQWLVTAVHLGIDSKEMRWEKVKSES